MFESLSMFIQTHSKPITIFALILAFCGTALLAWDFIQWSNTKRAKFNQEYGTVIAFTQNIAKQKWGSILLGCAIMAQLIVELCKKNI